MASKRPTTVDAYIKAAPSEAQPHLRKVHAILKSVAPDAQEVIKWGNPFFVEPRFLFAYSAHKNHMSFAPSAEALEAFRDELKAYQTTKHFLKIPYKDVVPEALIRKIAGHCVGIMSSRKDAGFW
ncbi:MAG: DUF1801 domain-containing protein [Dokdonella sp.]